MIRLPATERERMARIVAQVFPRSRAAHRCDVCLRGFYDAALERIATHPPLTEIQA